MVLSGRIAPTRAHSVLVLPFLFVPASPPPIIGGLDSGPSQDAVVHVRSFIDGQAAACGGTAVTPRIVLTARHCVIGLEGPFTTCEGAAFKPTSTAQLDSMTVSAGGDLTSPLAERSIVAIIGPGDRSVCGNDFVALILDAALPVKPLPVRIDRRSTVGELVTVAGWGWTDTTPLPLNRQERQHVPILDVATTTSSWTVPGDLVLGESICDGDSGAPLISEASGALIGVVSRNHHDDTQEVIPPGSCEGDSVRNVAGPTAAMVDVLMLATAETGETLLEEEPPPGATLAQGASCTADDECLSGRCVTDTRGAACSTICAEQRPCGPGLLCVPSDGLLVCTRGVEAATAEGGEGSCAIGATTSSGQGGAGFGLLFAIAALSARWRHRVCTRTISA